MIEPDDLMEMGQLTEEQVDHIVGQADTKAEEAEQAAAAERRRLKEQERIDRATAEAEALERARTEAEAQETAKDGVEQSEPPDTLDRSEIELAPGEAAPVAGEESAEADSATGSAEDTRLAAAASLGDGSAGCYTPRRGVVAKPLAGRRRNAISFSDRVFDRHSSCSSKRIADGRSTHGTTRPSQPGRMDHGLVTTTGTRRRTGSRAVRKQVRRAEVPIRIYALAKDLKIDSKELVEFCTKAGITGKGSALASLTDDEVEKVKSYLGGGKKPEPSAPIRPVRPSPPTASSKTASPPTASSKAASSKTASSFTRDDYISPGARGRATKRRRHRPQSRFRRHPTSPAGASPTGNDLPGTGQAAAENWFQAGREEGAQRAHRPRGGDPPVAAEAPAPQVRRAGAPETDHDPAGGCDPERQVGQPRSAGTIHATAG